MEGDTRVSRKPTRVIRHGNGIPRVHRIRRLSVRNRRYIIKRRHEIDAQHRGRDINDGDGTCVGLAGITDANAVGHSCRVQTDPRPPAKRLSNGEIRRPQNRRRRWKRGALAPIEDSTTSVPAPGCSRSIGDEWDTNTCLGVVNGLCIKKGRWNARTRKS